MALLVDTNLLDIVNQFNMRCLCAKSASSERSIFMWWPSTHVCTSWRRTLSMHSHATTRACCTGVNVKKMKFSATVPSAFVTEHQLCFFNSTHWGYDLVRRLLTCFKEEVGHSIRLPKATIVKPSRCSRIAMKCWLNSSHQFIAFCLVIGHQLRFLFRAGAVLLGTVSSARMTLSRTFVDTQAA